MKKVLVFILIFNTLLLATNDKETDVQKKARAQKHLKEQMEKEKKYSKEQTFYQNKDYDFKGAEVNPDSLKTLPDLEEDDLDMDSVYD